MAEENKNKNLFISYNFFEQIAWYNIEKYNLKVKFG